MTEEPDRAQEVAKQIMSWPQEGWTATGLEMMIASAVRAYGDERAKADHELAEHHLTKREEAEAALAAERKTRECADRHLAEADDVIERVARESHYFKNAVNRAALPSLPDHVASIVGAAEGRVGKLEEALREILPRYEHLCKVLVIRDSTHDIGERAREALLGAEGQKGWER